MSAIREMLESLVERPNIVVELRSALTGSLEQSAMMAGTMLMQLSSAVSSQVEEQLVRNAEEHFKRGKREMPYCNIWKDVARAQQSYYLMY